MLVIFDWDGTLSDSTGKIVRCVQRAADDLGLASLGDEAIKDIIGLSLSQAVGQLYPGLNEKGVEDLAETYRHHYLHDGYTPELYPGAQETLDQLKAQGLLLGVATGKTRKGLERVLQETNLVDFFDATRCADETASKPDPKMLSELLVECDRRSEETVMVGDTEFDMAMAQAVDMPRVAVSYGAHHPDRLMKYEPILCVDDLREMVASVEKMLPS